MLPIGPHRAEHEMAGYVQAPAWRGAAHWARLCGEMNRERIGLLLDRRRDHGDGVPGGAAAQGDARGQAGRGHTAGGRVG